MSHVINFLVGTAVMLTLVALAHGFCKLAEYFELTPAHLFAIIVSVVTTLVTIYGAGTCVVWLLGTV